MQNKKYTDEQIKEAMIKISKEEWFMDLVQERFEAIKAEN